MSPIKQFENELSAVFVRWWEESDIDEHDMAETAMLVIDRFCSTDIEFEADFDLDEIEE